MYKVFLLQWIKFGKTKIQIHFTTEYRELTTKSQIRQEKFFTRTPWTPLIVKVHVLPNNSSSTIRRNELKVSPMLFPFPFTSAPILLLIWNRKTSRRPGSTSFLEVVYKIEVSYTYYSYRDTFHSVTNSLKGFQCVLPPD